MSFLESIQLKDGQIQSLDYHQKRLDFTWAEHTFFPRKWDLSQILQQYDLPQAGTYKIRVVYTSETIEVNWQPYQIRPVRSLQVVHTTHLDYTYKSTHRTPLQILFDQRGSADDIIICKDGWITDSYYANLAFYKAGRWYTPSQPLLKGTKRQQLLDQKSLTAIPIRLEDLPQFEQVALINAMISLEDEVWVNQAQVYF